MTILGFFSLETGRDEGNLGLWDQYMGLRFVRNNIKEFGGNPGNITLWGQSAGSASVDALCLSPRSRGKLSSFYKYIILNLVMFQKVYQSSGSIFCNWGTKSPSVRSTKRIAVALGCQSQDPHEIKEFLKEAKWQDILKVTSTDESVSLLLL